VILGVNMHCSVRQGGGGDGTVEGNPPAKVRSAEGGAKFGEMAFHRAVKGTLKEIIGVWDPQTSSLV